MTRAILVCLADDEGEASPHASEAAARRALPGVTFSDVVILEESRLGTWLRNHRGHRCRTLRDVQRCPERKQAVVLDADLPPSAWG